MALRKNREAQREVKKDPIELPLNEVSFASGDVIELQNDYKPRLYELQEVVEKKFTSKKKKNEVLGAAYLFLGEEKRADRVFDCGTFLEYRLYESSKKSKLVRANFCKDRLCPVCNWRRSRKIFSKLSNVMNQLQEDGYRFLFLTLTVRNCLPEDLSDTLQLMNNGWGKLHKKKRFKDSIAGVFKSLEITRNTSVTKGHELYGTYHPHFHCVLAVRKSYFKKGYISHKEWMQLWKDSCGLNYEPVVDIRTCYDFDKDIKDTDGEAPSKYYVKAGLEAAKYSVKDVDYLDASDMDETVDSVLVLMEALKGLRLCEPLGVFRMAAKNLSIEFKNIEAGDLTDKDLIRADLDYMTVYYSWHCGVYIREVVFRSQV